MENRAGQGFHPIGIQAQKIANSLYHAGSTPKRSGPSSLTTGVRLPVPLASNSTGRALSTTVVANLPSETNVKDPAEVDRLAMDSLPACVRSALKPVWRESFGDGGWDGEIVGYELSDCNAVACIEAAESLAPYLACASPSLVQSELARLRVSTKSRNEQPGDGAMMAAVYAELLSEFPPDIVTWACRKWARQEKFWPSLSELRELLDWGIKRRKSLLAELASKVTAA